MESRKNALVTGASRGIGKATAVELSRRGYTLAVHYVENKAAAEDTLAFLEGSGHFICNADLSDMNEIMQLFDLLDQRFDQIDVVVNNAAIAIKHPLEMQAEDWIENFKRTIDVNLHGAALVCHQALQRMMKAECGTIVNVTSRGAYRSEPSMPGYAAGKAALNSLTQSFAKASGKHGVSVVAVAPGFVETDMSRALLSEKELEAVKAQSPMNRIAQPEEVAKLISFLCEPDSKHLSGAVVDINGASYFR